MAKRGRKKKYDQDQQQEHEDWCFECKDGGEIVLCGRNCGKAYHPDCIDQDDSLFKAKSFVCGWHYCIKCRHDAKFFCLGCPNGSLCNKCLDASELTIFKGEKGLCSECSNLVLIIEQNLEHDSEGNKLSLNDMETYEGLFKEYWEIVKAKEGLSSNDVVAALDNSKKVTNFMLQSNSSEGGEENVNESTASESEEDRTCKRKPIRRKSSNSLGRRPSNSRGKPLLKKGDVFIKPSSFASINAKNINLVYLKQSLVLKLSEESENFMDKVVGAFVRVKVDSNGCKQRNTHHLVKVIGIVLDEMSNGILLQVSFMAKAIPISEISDVDFTEEECEDLQQKVKAGMLPKLTVVELQEKAKVLHEDITKHWIATRLVYLQNQIDRANLRGRHREKDALIDKKEDLAQTWKQEALLRNVPSVSAELIDERYDPGEADRESQ